LQTVTLNTAIAGYPEFKGEVGLAKTLAITKKHSETPIMDLVKEQWILSRLPIHSSKPTRLPGHIHLADKGAKDVMDGLIREDIPGPGYNL